MQNITNLRRFLCKIWNSKKCRFLSKFDLVLKSINDNQHPSIDILQVLILNVYALTRFYISSSTLQKSGLITNNIKYLQSKLLEIYENEFARSLNKRPSYNNHKTLTENLKEEPTIMNENITAKELKNAFLSWKQLRLLINFPSFWVIDVTTNFINQKKLIDIARKRLLELQVFYNL